MCKSDKTNVINVLSYTENALVILCVVFLASLFSCQAFAQF